jgi:hypothetical protein
MSHGRKPGAWCLAMGGRAADPGTWRTGRKAKGDKQTGRRGTGIDGPLETKSPAGVNPRGANNRVGNLATVPSYRRKENREEAKEAQG